MLLISTFTSSFVFADDNTEDKLKLVALGDSITFGSGLESGSQPFPNLIGNGFIDLEVENLGVPGATSTDLKSGLAGVAEELQSADVVTLTIGGNDLLQNETIQGILASQSINLTPQELLALGNNIATTFTQNLGEIIYGIRQQTDAPIVLYTIYNPFGPTEVEPYKSVHGFGENILGIINTAIKSIGAQQGLLIADAYTAFAGNQSNLMLPNDVHPNTDGHQVLAGLANQKLLNLLNPTPPVEEPVEEEPVEEEPVDVPGEDKPVLVALGDSITFGLTLDDRNLAFPHLLGDGVSDVHSFGFPGYTSLQLLTELQSNQDITSTLQNADAVTLNIGNNDLLQAVGIGQALQTGSPNVLTEELHGKVEEATGLFAQNLQQIIGIIRTQTDAPIILYNLYNPFGESENELLNSFHLLGEQIVPTINNNVINPIAFHTRTLVADAYSAFAGNQALYITAPDRVHPNEAGHQALAKAGQEAALVPAPVEEEPPVVEEPVEEEPPVVEEPVEEEPPVVEEPVEEQPVVVQPVDEDEDEDKETPAPISNDSGNKLPNTATSMYNYLAVGAGLLLSGIILFFIQYRRRLV